MKRRRKSRRVGDERYLAWIRRQPCEACRQPPPNEAAHTHGSGGGTAVKGDDRRTIPLCHADHTGSDNSYHNISERRFAALHGIDIEARIASLQARHHEETGR